MVIAVKRDDKITVGITTSDSLVNMTEKDLVLPENIPFWKVNGTDDCYVFAEDLNYAVDLLRFNDYLFKDITDGNSIITNFIPKMKELLALHEQIVEGKEWGSQLLIVKGNKMFTVGNYFVVAEVDEFVGMGYEPYLLGALSEARDMPANESILFAVRSLNRMMRKQLFPLVIFDNQTKKKKIYYK